MGTRSLIVFKQGRKTLATLSGQYDGMPSTVGADIRDCFKRKRVTPGVADKRRCVVDAGDMAVQLIAYLKTESTRDGLSGRRGPVNQGGGWYLCPANTKQRDVDAEYVYTLTCPEVDYGDIGVVQLKIEACEFDGANRRTLYIGPADGFDPDTVESEWGDTDDCGPIGGPADAPAAELTVPA